MGQIQDSSDQRMSEKQRCQSGKRRKTGHENEGSRGANSRGGGAEATPAKDRRPWTHEEEMNLVRVLLEHGREGRILPLQSKTALYWTDLIAQVYPGEKGITQRRLYDKVRRMHHRYNEILLQERDTPWKSMHEKALFDFWKKIFPNELNTNKAMHETGTRILHSVSNGNSVKVVQVSDSSEEQDEDDDDEERVPIAKVTWKASLPTQESSGSEDEDEEDDRSPEKRRSVPLGRNGTRAEASRFAQEEMRKTASLLRDDHVKSTSKLGFKQFRGSEKEKLPRKERLHDEENGERRSKGGAGQLRLTTTMVRSLKAELFEYVNNLRNDCMRELDEVRSHLIDPTQLQSTRRRQDLILEELSLQEKELEISRRYCRLQKEAVKLRKASLDRHLCLECRCSDEV